MSESRVISCCACHGSRLGKKGKPCKTCKGTGLLSVEKFDGLLGLVKEEMTCFMERSMRDLLGKYAIKGQQMAAPEEESKSIAIHEGIACVACGSFPIQGVLYKCTICQDFNMCSKCEADSIHEEHALLKIRKPAAVKAAPVEQLVAVQGLPEVVLIKEILAPGLQFPDKYEVSAGQNFVKQWLFKNSGDHPWPKDVKFVKTEGDEFQRNSSVVTYPMKQLADGSPGNLMPGEEALVTISFEAPQRVGPYITYYSFSLQSGELFGHKVWCRIEVMDEEHFVVEEGEESYHSIDAEVEEPKVPAEEQAAAKQAQNEPDVGRPTW